MISELVYQKETVPSQLKAEGPNEQPSAGAINEALVAHRISSAKNAQAHEKMCARARGVLVLAMIGLRISSYPKFWCVTFL